MEFGILFTSHPDTEAEPYPHRDVHARVTQQILRADELGYDYAWIAEHHFSNEYGIMPDVFVYAGYLAALTKRIRSAPRWSRCRSPIRCGSRRTPLSSTF
jgi:alkanesulfonate monooxygenase SsuD/methylene tetrahydromethanopterin reductase-like flavin-dependent oxidoreductase (luciferase family)